MKGQIILPEFYKARYTDNYKFLLSAIASKYGFSYEYTDDPVIYPETELVITFAIPQHNRVTNYPWIRFINLPKHIKLITWLRDIQCYGDPDCFAAICAMMERADVIISNFDSYFHKIYSEYEGKMYYMGDFFASHERYDLGINPAPVYKKCLLSGSCFKKSYPLRYSIGAAGRLDIILWVPPPHRGIHDYIGDKYAKLLHRFFCCVTASGIFGGVVSKHMEIPASGSLMITNVKDDLLKLGYEPMHHFVPITDDNAIETIENVLNDPGRYQYIREAGHEFVHRNHGLNNRIEELSSLINNVMEF